MQTIVLLQVARRASRLGCTEAGRLHKEETAHTTRKPRRGRGSGQGPSCRLVWRARRIGPRVVTGNERPGKTRTCSENLRAEGGSDSWHASLLPTDSSAFRFNRDVPSVLTFVLTPCGVPANTFAPHDHRFARPCTFRSERAQTHAIPLRGAPHERSADLPLKGGRYPQF